MTVPDRPQDLKYTALFVFTVLVYGALLLLSPALGPTDDYAFLSTLQSGKPLPVYGHNFPFYDDARLGRFDPLVAQEYNLVAPISRTPTGYYLFNAVQLVVFAFLLYRILHEATDDNRVVVGAALLVFLSPGFTNAWFRLELGERGAAFFLAVFLSSHLWLRRTGSLLAAAQALASTNIALYYKEPVFLALGTYAAAHLALSGQKAAKAVRVVDGLTVASALVFITMYYLRVYPYRGAWQYANSVYPWTVVAAKNLLNYGLFSDPLAILLALPLTAFRAWQVLVRREPAHPVFDSMLLAGCAYASIFFVMNIYSPYYFLPLYVFVLPALVYLLVTQRYLARATWRLLTGVVIVVLALNTVPASLHYLTYNKYLPVNFNETIGFLASDIRARADGGRRRIFLDGVDRAKDRADFLIFGEFLQHRGLTLREFDMESDLEANRPTAPAIFRDKYLSEYGAYRGGPAPAPAPGDYLVVSPDSERDVNTQYLRSLDTDYRLVFATHSPFALPAYTAKALVKRILAGRLTTEQENRQGLIVSENLTELPDYYVFVRR